MVVVVVVVVVAAAAAAVAAAAAPEMESYSGWQQLSAVTGTLSLVGFEALD